LCVRIIEFDLAAMIGKRRAILPIKLYENTQLEVP
jgi:hypothetical protein